MGALLDLLQLHQLGLSLHDTLGIGFTLVLVVLLFWAYRKRIKELNSKLDKIAKALIRDDQPIDFKKLIDQQDAFLILLRGFIETPWRFCDRQDDCPGIKRTEGMFDYIKETTDRYYNDHRERLERATEETKAEVQALRREVAKK